MSDEASDEQNFLRRWSRRKRAAAAGVAPDADGAPEAPVPGREMPGTGTETAPQPRTDRAEVAPASRQDAAETAPAAEFDLSQLPSIDSIGADTDIRGFLRPGVPLALRNAALKRAWSADPAIRDFVGLSENAWDFNAVDGAPGFGALPEGADVRRLVAEILGEKNEPTPSDHKLVMQEAPEPAAAPADAPTAQDHAIEGENPPGEDAPEKPPGPRRHGGALPT